MAESRAQRASSEVMRSRWSSSVVLPCVAPANERMRTVVDVCVVDDDIVYMSLKGVGRVSAIVWLSGIREQK